MGILVDPDLVQHDMTIKGSPKVKSTRSNVLNYDTTNISSLEDPEGLETLENGDSL